MPAVDCPHVGRDLCRARRGPELLASLERERAGRGDNRPVGFAQTRRLNRRTSPAASRLASSRSAIVTRLPSSKYADRGFCDSASPATARTLRPEATLRYASGCNEVPARCKASTFENLAGKKPGVGQRLPAGGMTVRSAGAAQPRFGRIRQIPGGRSATGRGHALLSRTPRTR